MRVKALYCLLVFVAGCSQVPKPSTYPYSFQHKMQAAHHWNVLANDVVGALIANLRSGAFSPGEAVYVQSDDRSPFGRAFRSFLITKLTKQGIIVSTTPETPLKIDWAVQLVAHNADRINPPLPLANTFIAGLATGVAAGWNELDSFAAGGLTAGVVGLLLDFLYGTDSFATLPHSEVIITTMITDGNDIRMRESTPFYINDEDRRHYWARPDIRPDISGTGAPMVVHKVYTVVDR